MKNIQYTLFILLLSGSLEVNAQSAKDEQQVIAKTQLLSSTVFGTKDSMTLERLFAKKASYGHSHGNLQTREEAIKGISKNRSVYKDTSIKDIRVLFGSKTTAIVRYLYDADENKTDGTVTPLRFSMMLVWIKVNGEWKLFGRQAVSR
ncbi:MAG: nuclear transport factor 2 family protein [Bacteroidota bacterium]